MDLIDQTNLTVLVTTHLVFCVNENQAVLSRPDLPEREKFMHDAATLFPVISRHPVLDDDLSWADRAVMLPLGGRC